MMELEPGRPEPGEHAPYFERYISRVPEADILAVLEKQIDHVLAFLGKVTPQQETFRYAEDKWSIREVLGHVIDAERVFGYRALGMARGEAASLPGFDENAYARQSRVHEVPLEELLAEFEYLRRSHILFFRHLAAEDWKRTGVCNQAPASARALAFILAGHVRHHLHILQERYLAAAGES